MLSNSVIDTTIKPNKNNAYGACIGLCRASSSVTLNCGTIAIKNVAENFLGNLKYEGNGTNKGWKIGKGYNGGGTINFSGGSFNGTSFTDAQFYQIRIFDYVVNPIATFRLSIILISSLYPSVDNLNSGSPTVSKI